MAKDAIQATVKSYSLTGELMLSKSGWLLLHVPNDVGRGAFKALNEPGIELPTDTGGQYNAHISVMSPEEIQQIGGASRVSERGKEFSYSLGRLCEFEPDGWREMERCWALEVHSPDLEKLRKSYGLSAIPSDGKHKFHITVAVRRRGILRTNDITKATEPTEDSPSSTVPSFKLHDKPGVHLIKASSGALVLRATDRACRRVLEKRADFRDAFRSLLEPIVREWLGKQGFSWGQFHPNQNWVDTMEQAKFMDTQNEAMRLAAEQDSSPMKILHGFHALLGGKWDPSMAQQDDVLHKSFAAVSPYLQRWSPYFFDQLHGGNSAASLASAIAETHRYRDPDMTATDVATTANKILTGINANPRQHQRFSSQELGEIYREAARRGWIARDTPLDKLPEQIGRFADVASAARDTTAGSAQPLRKISDIFDHIDKVKAQYPGQSITQVADNMRDTRELGRTGGMMGNALWRGNIALGGQHDPSMEMLDAKNDQLMKNVRESSVGRMVGATEALKQEGRIPPGSAAEKFLERARSGGLTREDVDNWPKMLTQSTGLSQSTAELMMQDKSNSHYLTPDLLTGVRASQGNIDVKPFMDSYDQQYNEQNDPGGIIRRSLKNQFAQSQGYEDAHEYDLLQGDNTKNFITSYQDAHNRGQYAKSQSHIGWQAPVARLSQGLQQPAPTVASLGKSFFNWQPTAAPMPTPPPGTFASTPSTPSPPTAPMPTPPPGTFASMPTPPTAPAAPAVPTPPEAPGMTVTAMFKEAVGPGFRGIPDRNDMGDLGQLSPEEIVDLIIQRHDARRAGVHRDLRIGDRERGLYSWAMRSEGMPTPGQKVLANQQPLHAHAYGAFQGTLGPGYGQGTVRRERKGRILITNANPTKIEFTTADTSTPERFVLFKPPKGFGEKQWLLMNTTPTEAPAAEKPHFKTIPAEEVEPMIDKMQTGTTYQAKLDGARSLTKLMKGGVEVLSYRQSARTGGPILHTERMFGGRPKVDYPKHLEGTTLVGELTGRTPEGDVMAPQATGGLLNSTIENSLKAQKSKGVGLHQTLFDAQTIGKKPVDYANTPYAERRKIIEQILPYLPKNKIRMSEQVEGPESGKALWRKITSGEHPETHEGMVIYPPTGNPMKAKQLQESDVHITGTFPGQGKYQGRGIGGFTYGLEPGGATVGEVGTGLSDELRAHAFQNPDDYVGRIARIHSQEQFPSGAYRAPAFLALHEG